MVQHKPLVSVIIPTHKRPAALRNALASVFAQERAGEDFDLEVIVVYDMPSDVPREIRDQFPEVRYIKQDGQGPSAARNVGIKAGKGNYVAFLDDDDVWLSHRLRVQIPIMENKREVFVLYGQAIVTGDCHLDAWPETAPSGRVFEAFLTRMDDFIATDTLLIRRGAFETVGYFDETIPTDEHYDLCLRLAFYFPFIFVPGPVARGHFSTTEGVWHTSILNGAFERTLPYVIEKALALLPANPVYDSLRRRARTLVVSTIVRNKWELEGVTRARDYLLSTLQTHSWMVEEESILEILRRVSYELASSCTTPLTKVRELCAELKALIACRGLRTRLKLQKALSVLWTGAATALFSNGFYGAALSCFIRAVIYDPTRVVHQNTWKLLRRRLFKHAYSAVT